MSAWVERYGVHSMNVGRFRLTVEWRGNGKYAAGFERKSTDTLYDSLRDAKDAARELAARDLRTAFDELGITPEAGKPEPEGSGR